jgi:hypothetical protein
VGLDGGPAERELLELDLMPEARGDGAQAVKRRGDDLGPDAIPGEYRDAGSHARRS